MGNHETARLLCRQEWHWWLKGTRGWGPGKDSLEWWESSAWSLPGQNNHQSAPYYPFQKGCVRVIWSTPAEVSLKTIVGMSTNCWRDKPQTGSWRTTRTNTRQLKQMSGQRFCLTRNCSPKRKAQPGRSPSQQSEPNSRVICCLVLKGQPHCWGTAKGRQRC